MITHFWENSQAFFVNPEVPSVHNFLTPLLQSIKERKRRMEDAQEKGIDAKWVIKDASLVNLLKRTSSNMDPVRETTGKHDQ